MYNYILFTDITSTNSLSNYRSISNFQRRAGTITPRRTFYENFNTFPTHISLLNLFITIWIRSKSG